MNDLIKSKSIRDFSNDYCPVCDCNEYTLIETKVRDFEYLSPGDYDWIACKQCNLVRINPIPDNEQLALAYPPNYHAFQTPESILTKTLMRVSLSRTAKKNAKALQDGDSILDIGCSTGDLLYAISKYGDYNLYGVEYSDDIAKIARSKGIHVQSGAFEDAKIPSLKYDLIIMQHVLEHVIDPMLTLTKCYEGLKCGGKLTGELPNFDSWDARLFGKYWGGGHTPRHIWHFSPDNLHSALKKAGFSAIEIYPSLHTGHWACSFQNYFRKSRNDDSGLKNGRAWYYPIFLILMIPVNAIQMMFMKTGVMRFQCEKS